MSAEHNDDFFVGYLPMTRNAARRSLLLGIAVLLLTLALGLALSFSQSRGGAGLEPWRDGGTFTGIYRARPYPHLRYRDERGDPAVLLLVSSGKSGADLPATLDGQGLEMTGGTLLGRDRSRMLAGGSSKAVTLSPDDREALSLSAEISLGEIRLEGEIVDSKCYFGAMRPGRGQIHRACAQICIAGGIPPLLAVPVENGGELHVLLCGPNQTPVNELVLPLVAEPIAIRGQLFERAGQLVLEFNPEGIDFP